ncbi:MAG: hypothetical protein BWY66_01429 [bacterium ADurb.Bin374]|nr:MAG: hypothetical protein BWY66_01429 [bacterium ADurb.Bin374]
MPVQQGDDLIRRVGFRHRGEGADVRYQEGSRHRAGLNGLIGCPARKILLESARNELSQILAFAEAVDHLVERVRHAAEFVRARQGELAGIAARSGFPEAVLDEPERSDQVLEHHPAEQIQDAGEHGGEDKQQMPVTSFPVEDVAQGDAGADNVVSGFPAGDGDERRIVRPADDFGFQPSRRFHGVPEPDARPGVPDGGDWARKEGGHAARLRLSGSELGAARDCVHRQIRHEMPAERLLGGDLIDDVREDAAAVRKCLGKIQTRLPARQTECLGMLEEVQIEVSRGVESDRNEHRHVIFLGVGEAWKSVFGGFRSEIGMGEPDDRSEEITLLLVRVAVRFLRWIYRTVSAGAIDVHDVQIDPPTPEKLMRLAAGPIHGCRI